MHDPMMLGAPTDDLSKVIALTQHTKVRGGALRLHQGNVTQEHLERFAETLGDLTTYTAALIGLLYGIPTVQDIAELAEPALPNALELKRLKVIEAKRQARELPS